MPVRFLLIAALALPTAAVEPPATAARIVQKTNAFRQAQGLPKVSVDKSLEQAAQHFARYIANTGRYGHGADGHTPAERAAAQGYAYCIVEENLAMVYRSDDYASAEALAGEMVEGWKNSPGHRRNMLEPAVTQTGVALAQAADGRYFGVQMFGRPKSQAIRFAVRNLGDKEVRYTLDGHAFALGPRVTRTHSVCRPVELGIPSRGFSAPAKNGETYEIRD